jgi:hypothetical protein
MKDAEIILGNAIDLQGLNLLRNQDLRPQLLQLVRHAQDVAYGEGQRNARTSIPKRKWDIRGSKRI